jgi:hypothetical protein
VHLGELLDDGKPQPQAAMPPRRAGVGLAEAVEDVRQEIGRDADAGVDDADLDVRVERLGMRSRRRSCVNDQATV